MTPKKSTRGFASMSQDARAAIASKGGKAAHALGTAHEYTPEAARIAGAKGGIKVSANRKHMAEIGRLGGLKRAARMAERASQDASPSPLGERPE